MIYILTMSIDILFTCTYVNGDTRQDIILARTGFYKGSAMDLCIKTNQQEKGIPFWNKKSC